MGKMTPKQERFVQEYLTDLNASAAARRAGYSERNADKIASELLGKTGVSGAIREALAARAKKMELDSEFIISRLVEIVESRKAGDASITASAAVRALEILGKHIGMFSDKIKIEHSGEVNVRAEIRAAALAVFRRQEAA